MSNIQEEIIDGDILEITHNDQVYYVQAAYKVRRRQDAVDSKVYHFVDRTPMHLLQCVDKLSGKSIADLSIVLGICVQLQELEREAEKKRRISDKIADEQAMRTLWLVILFLIFIFVLWITPSVILGCYKYGGIN